MTLVDMFEGFWMLDDHLSLGFPWCGLSLSGLERPGVMAV